MGTDLFSTALPDMEYLCFFCKNYFGKLSESEREDVDKVKVFAEHMKYDHKVSTNAVLCFVVSLLEDDDIDIARGLLKGFNNEKTNDHGSIYCLFCQEQLKLVTDLGGDLRLETVKIHFSKRHLLVERTDILVELNRLDDKKRSELVNLLIFKSQKINEALRLNVLWLQREESTDLALSRLESTLNAVKQSNVQKRRKHIFTKIRSDKGIKKFPVRVFNCEFCEYTSVSKKYIENHLRTHTGEKPYECQSCDYKCSSSSGLHQHTRRHHTKKKNHLCPECGKSFF